MATPLVPQEILLLERYSSLDYFGETRDAWKKMLDAAEEALQQFMHRLPADYRRRHLSQQPDVVWAERVLPNFRSTLESLNEGYVLLSHGDMSALGFGGNVQSAIKGQATDYPTEWMPKELEDQFWHWQAEAGTRAFNMSITEYAGWTAGSLTSRYSEQARGPLNAPAAWPNYRLNPAVTVATGALVALSGIYMPACDDSCAEVLIKDYEAFRARVGYNPQTTHEMSRASTTWTLVERITGGSVDSDARQLAVTAAQPSGSGTSTKTRPSCDLQRRFAARAPSMPRCQREQQRSRQPVLTNAFAARMLSGNSAVHTQPASTSASTARSARQAP